MQQSTEIPSSIFYATPILSINEQYSAEEYVIIFAVLPLQGDGSYPMIQYMHRNLVLCSSTLQAIVNFLYKWNVSDRPRLIDS